ncbi:MAG: hypothetical protein J6K48_03610 [Lachnospiraceae bacterium]|nr:hypothetical protein [Lachnospiraceae bacterium]
MFELIVIIIIIVWVIKKKQKDAAGGPKGNGQIPNTTVTTANPKGNNRYAGRSTNAGTNINMGNGSAHQRRSLHQTGKKSAIEEAKEDGHSTTAYLMEKAEADAREHEKEKYEEQMRLHRASGGLAVAERLFDGDPVPQGKRCVICGYCAAENLVPMVPRTRYSCYFCREPLT